MTLTVEDGSGISGAQSYNTVDEIAAYAADRGLEFVTSPPEPAEQAARRAATWLDGLYRKRWPGVRAKGRAQSRDWPRTGARDTSGEEIADDEVPEEVKAAHCEASIREFASPGILAPDYVAAQQVAREKVGSLEVEYRDNVYSAEDARPCITAVDDILSGLVRNSHASVTSSLLLRL